MLSKSVFVRWFSFAATAAVIGASTAPAQAHQALQRFNQAEQRAPNGRIAVEASVITVVACNSPGERGGQYYIYQYVNRPGFRAILPPNWGAPIGGRDFGSFNEAAGAACRSGGGGAVSPQAASRGSLTGVWGAYTFVQTGDTYTWRANNEVVQGTINGDDLVARWPNGSSLTGKVTRRNAQGDPTQIAWSNGVVMTR